MKTHLRSTVAAISLLGLAACAENGTFATQSGPPVTHNATPYDGAFTCTKDALAGKPRTRISVGQVKDYTGKFSNEASEGGYKVTQGGSLMVISALGKLSPQVELIERFDTQIPEMELGLAKAQLLRDQRGDQEVVRVPTAGQVQGSDFYIVGGITEVNYNIQSGGVELNITGVGAGARYFVMNIAADLRLVETRTMRVVRTISLQKQVVGEEVKANIFRFFTNQLVDFNAGTKNQEPIQLGVRSTLEAGVLELVSAAYGVDFAPCRSAVNAKFVGQSASTAPAAGPRVAEKS